MKSTTTLFRLSGNALRVLKVSEVLRASTGEKRLHFAKIDGEIYAVERENGMPNARIFWRKIPSNISPSLYPTQAKAILDLSRALSGLWVFSQAKGWQHTGNP